MPGASLSQGGSHQLVVSTKGKSSVARASLVSLVKFFDATEIHRARQVADEELPAVLAEYLTWFGVRQRTAWLFIKRGTISTNQASLSQGWLLGQLPAHGGGLVLSGFSIAQALNIPPSAKIFLRSDSTLTHYPIADPAKWGRRQGTGREDIGLCPDAIQLSGRLRDELRTKKSCCGNDGTAGA